MTRYHLPVVVEKDADGWTAWCLDFQGCYAQGESYEETLSNIRDVIALHIEDRRACGENVPTHEHVSFTSVDVEA